MHALPRAGAATNRKLAQIKNLQAAQSSVSAAVHGTITQDWRITNYE
jgi:hypothetical protein